MIEVILEKLSDLTQENLEYMFRKYYRDENLSIKIITGQQDFLGQNDQFQSEIKKWTISIDKNGEKRELSFIGKETVNKSLQLFNTRVTRPFFTEVFWYKFAFPVLKKEFPEISTISPTSYYAYSNYEDSFRPDCFDKNCGNFCRMIHHKNEAGLIVMEDACQANRQGGLPSMVVIDKTKIMSLKQVTAAVKTLAIFHGTWWVWMRRKKNEDVPEFVDSPMNIEDVEYAFMKGKKMERWMMKSWFDKQFKQFIKLAKLSGASLEMMSKIKVALKDKIYEDMEVLIDTSKESSIIKTMTHGDFWVNNMLFSSADPEADDLMVTLLDFQLNILSHPGRDIWYLLYVNTDREFREKHLQTVLQEYFRAFSAYLQMEDVKFSFENFLKEINRIRFPMAFTFALMVMYVSLNPEPMDFGTFAGTKHFEECMKRQLGSEPTETDDPAVVEIRRRMFGTMTEMVEGGFI